MKERTDPSSIAPCSSVLVTLGPVDSIDDDVKSIRGTLSPQLAVPPLRLLQSLSFSHFAKLVAVHDALKRRSHEKLRDSGATP